MTMLQPVLSALAVVLLTAGPLVASGPEGGPFVTGVDVQTVLNAALGKDVEVALPLVSVRGVDYTIMDTGRAIGGVTVGVFADSELARGAFEGHLAYMSVGPKLEMSGRVGQKGVAWEQSVLFLRDNAVVFLALRQGNVQDVALVFDEALSRGGKGVERGSQLSAPRIVGIECPASVALGQKVPMTVRVAVPVGAFADHFGFADRRGIATGYLLPVDLNGQVEVVREFEYIAPRDPTQVGPKTFWVCYASRECVVTSRKVTVTVVPGEQGPPAS